MCVRCTHTQPRAWRGPGPPRHSALSGPRLRAWPRRPALRFHGPVSITPQNSNTHAPTYKQQHHSHTLSLKWPSTPTPESESCICPSSHKLHPNRLSRARRIGLTPVAAARGPSATAAPFGRARGGPRASCASHSAARSRARSPRACAFCSRRGSNSCSKRRTPKARGRPTYEEGPAALGGGSQRSAQSTRQTHASRAAASKATPVGETYL